ncbi:MAG: methyltransferase domain-containing protein [Rubrivivax sp.]
MSTTADWDPAQYLRFADHRLRPALDLLSRVPGRPKTVVDLGCGAGNVTQALAARWPEAAITGVDGSEAMLAQARQTLPSARWQLADIAGWAPEAPPELIFSNAALHWLPAHTTLLPQLAGLLAPGGTLAVQMPRNHGAPSHTAIADTVHAGPWRTRLEPLLRPAPVAEPAAYYDWLQPLAAALEIWETEYLQPLQGEDPVKEWTKSTALKPLLDALAGAEREAFEADYAARLRTAYPRRADGTTLFPFRRLFIVLRRPG